MSLLPEPSKVEKRKYPSRKIVRVLNALRGRRYDVELSCGHKLITVGIDKARCWKCPPNEKHKSDQKSRHWFLKQPRKWRYLLAYHYKRNPIGDADGAFLEQLWEAQQGLCAYCECDLGDTNDSWSLEHMTPIYRGGTNAKDNLCFACWDCNSRKGTQTYEEFTGQRAS